MSWCSKRQPSVSLSTTEAEYKAAAMTAQECTWLMQLLKDLHQSADDPVLLLCDNQSAIRLAEIRYFMQGRNIWRCNIILYEKRFLKETLR